MHYLNNKNIIKIIHSLFQTILRNIKYTSIEQIVFKQDKDIRYDLIEETDKKPRERSPIHDLSIELIHGRGKNRTPFAIAAVGKWKHLNRRYKALLTDDLRSSAPQSPLGTGSGMGSVIWNWDGRLK